jgi:hypothetical protein
LNKALAIINFPPDQQEAPIRQAQLSAIIALESAQKLAQKEIDRIKNEVIGSLLRNARTEPGTHMVELLEGMRGGCRVQELLIG